MTNRVDSLLEQVKILSVDEQVQLLAELHDLVSPPDPEWEKARADECERRAVALQRSETTADDAAVVMTRLRAKYLV